MGVPFFPSVQGEIAACPKLSLCYTRNEIFFHMRIVCSQSGVEEGVDRPFEFLERRCDPGSNR